MVTLPCCGLEVTGLGPETPGDYAMCGRCGRALSLSGGVPVALTAVPEQIGFLMARARSRGMVNGEAKVIRIIAIQASEAAIPFRYPCCGALISVHTGPGGHEPEVGDVGICSECGGILRYTVSDKRRGYIEAEVCDLTTLPDYVRDEALQMQSIVRRKIGLPTS